GRSGRVEVERGARAEGRRVDVEGDFLAVAGEAQGGGREGPGRAEDVREGDLVEPPVADRQAGGDRRWGGAHAGGGPAAVGAAQRDLARVRLHEVDAHEQAAEKEDLAGGGVEAQGEELDLGLLGLSLEAGAEEPCGARGEEAAAESRALPARGDRGTH